MRLGLTTIYSSALCVAISTGDTLGDTKAVYPFNLYGEYGVVDQDGRVVAKPEYRKPSRYDEGLGVLLWDQDDAAYTVLPNGTMYLLTEFDPEHESILVFDRYGVVCANTFPGEHQGDRIVDCVTGRIILDENQGVVFSRYFTNAISGKAAGTLPVFEIGSEREGVIDLNTGTVSWFDGYEVVGGISEGTIRVHTDQGYGYLAPDGSVLIAPQFQMAGPFFDGHALVGHADRRDETKSRMEHWKYINIEGKTVSEFTAYNIDNTLMVVDGLLCVMSETTQWGYINTSGEIVIPLVFEKVRPFSEGTAIVKLFEKPDDLQKLCEALDCDPGMVQARLGKWVVIDRRGRLIRHLPYSSKEPSASATGRILFPSAYESPVCFADGKQGGINRSYLVKQDGEIVWSTAELQ